VTRRLLASRRGQAMVEFALVLPIFLLLTIGVVDLGRGIWAYNTVAFLARDGARYGTIPGHFTPAIGTFVRGGCESMLSDPCAATIDVSYSCVTAPCGITALPAAAGGGQCLVSPHSPVLVHVHVTYPFEAVTAILWGGGPVSLQATSQMFVEQGVPGGCPP
jgi:Flp pilus assembly protein TadG